MTKLIDLCGERFGKLTVLNRAERLPGDKHTKWICKCDCGKTSTVTGINLKTGNTTSCGCARGPHGATGNPTWRCWHSMMTRCVWKSNSPRYQGIISVCDRWHDYRNFLKDMGERPSPKHSLDRIDNSGNYEPGNVRWATMKEQCRNRSSNHVIAVFGDARTITEWSEILGVSVRALRRYKNRNGSIDRHPKYIEWSGRVG